MRLLTNKDREDIRDWVFNLTDAEVISDPEFRAMERIVQEHRAAGWDRAHTLLCGVPRNCHKHSNPYMFVRARRTEPSERTT